MAAAEKRLQQLNEATISRAETWDWWRRDDYRYELHPAARAQRFSVTFTCTRLRWPVHLSFRYLFSLQHLHLHISYSSLLVFISTFLAIYLLSCCRYFLTHNNDVFIRFVTIIIIIKGRLYVADTASYTFPYEWTRDNFKTRRTPKKKRVNTW